MVLPIPLDTTANKNDSNTSSLPPLTRPPRKRRKKGEAPGKPGRPKGSKTIYKSGLPRKPRPLHPKRQSGVNLAFDPPQFVSYDPTTIQKSAISQIINEPMSLASSLALMKEKLSQGINTGTTVHVTAKWRQTQPAVPNHNTNNTNIAPLVRNEDAIPLPRKNTFASWQHYLFRRIHNGERVDVRDVLTMGVDTHGLQVAELLWMSAHHHPNFRVMQNTRELTMDEIRDMTVIQAADLELYLVLSPEYKNLKKFMAAKKQLLPPPPAHVSQRHCTPVVIAPEIPHYHHKQRFEIVVPPIPSSSSSIIPQILAVRNVEKQIVQIVYQHCAVPTHAISFTSTTTTNAPVRPHLETEIYTSMQAEGHLSMRHLSDGLWLCDPSRSDADVTRSIFLGRKSASYCFSNQDLPPRMPRWCCPVPAFRLLQNVDNDSPLIRACRRALVCRYFDNVVVEFPHNIRISQVEECLWDLVRKGWAVILDTGEQRIDPARAPPAMTITQAVSRFMPSPATQAFLLPTFRDAILASKPLLLPLSSLAPYQQGDELWIRPDGTMLPLVALSLLDRCQRLWYECVDGLDFDQVARETFIPIMGKHDTSVLCTTVRTEMDGLK